MYFNFDDVDFILFKTKSPFVKTINNVKAELTVKRNWHFDKNNDHVRYKLLKILNNSCKIDPYIYRFINKIKNRFCFQDVELELKKCYIDIGRGRYVPNFDNEAPYDDFGSFRIIKLVKIKFIKDNIELYLEVDYTFFVNRIMNKWFDIFDKNKQRINGANVTEKIRNL